LTADVARVFAGGVAESWALARHGPRGAARLLAIGALVPLLPLLPLVTLGIHLEERLKAASFFRAYLATLPAGAFARRPPLAGPRLALRRGA
jgi:hypothetical protein